MHSQLLVSALARTMSRLVGACAFLCVGLLSGAHAYATASAPCMAATAQVERALQLPDGFLSAISRVETGRPQADGRLLAWPWSVNAGGVGYQYHSLQEAVEAVKKFHQDGIQSIDVGCLQVNIMHHPNAFSSLEAAFDPYTNALYAGRFLKQMHDKTGSWPRAAAAYHSQTPSIGAPYLDHVLAEWAVPQDGRPLTPLKTIPLHATSFFQNKAPSAHPLAPLQEVKTPAAPSSTPDKPQRDFHPFKGFQHFSEPPSHPRMAGSQQSRNLAAYRRNPVRIVNTMPYPSSY
ncbi:transglycosylase SLT domain-containing protein [Saccharibacter floricola]|uniref:transglycosylase SLT domain-containing protein n=1 Tax=Saccharibacter floricola TaxID=231053 RepID=UPI00035E7583|nr:transglycosylase SLT domain-containing protein [Saccharibacter floricola]